MVTNEVIIIEDDEEVRTQLGLYLKGLSFEVTSYGSAEDYLMNEASATKRPVIFLLDINLPGLSGIDVLTFVRKINPISPIFVVSGELDPSLPARALKSGADDFIPKPYSIDHIGLKLSNARRKLEHTLSGMIDYGIKLIPESQLVCSNGKRIKLTQNEFRIVQFLHSEPGKIFGRDEIIPQLNDIGTAGRTIDVHIVQIRKKIAPLDIEIETVRGQGYRFISKLPDINGDQGRNFLRKLR